MEDTELDEQIQRNKDVRLRQSQTRSGSGTSASSISSSGAKKPKSNGSTKRSNTRQFNRIDGKDNLNPKNDKSSSSINRQSTIPDNSSAAPRSNRSQQRLLKAQKLLEMAQVSPSQRLEMEQRTKVFASPSSENSTISNGIAESVSIRPPPDDMYQMRMADTFDSVDNLVDSKSLLPGGRWVDGDANDGGSKSGGESEMEMRQKNTVAGQVAEVCWCLITLLLVWILVLSFSVSHFFYDPQHSHWFGMIQKKQRNCCLANLQRCVT